MLLDTERVRLLWQRTAKTEGYSHGNSDSTSACACQPVRLICASRRVVLIDTTYVAVRQRQPREQQSGRRQNWVEGPPAEPQLLAPGNGGRGPA